MAARTRSDAHPLPRWGALPFDLLVVTDPRLRSDLVGACRRLIRGVPPGRVALLLRAPGARPARKRAWERTLAPWCRRAGVLLLAHDPLPGEPLEADVAGVHLPARSRWRAAALRRSATHRLLVGRSCHDAAELRAAAAEGCDYATLSPLFTVPGKGPALGHRRFAELAHSARLPVVALGGLGLDPTGLAQALRAGAAAVAVRRAVFAAPDPAKAACSVLASLDRARADAS